MAGLPNKVKLLLGLTLIGITLSLYMVFIYAPTEREMGHVQRIFYFHMGSVWVATLAFLLVFIASIQYLRSKSRSWDILAYCSAEIGVIFLTLTIITGSIWAKPVWNVWWTWDPQLTTTFLLWILFIAYLLIRSAAGSDTKKARISAVFAIIAVLDLPVVYISVRVMPRGISPVVFGGRGGGIAPEMMHALLVSLVSFTLLFLLLLRLRMDLEKMQDRLESLRLGERTVDG